MPAQIKRFLFTLADVVSGEPGLNDIDSSFPAWVHGRRNGKKR